MHWLPRPWTWGRVVLLMGVIMAGACQRGAPPVARMPEPRIAVPAYFAPTTGESWPRLLEGTPAVGLAVINPATGPGNQLDERYRTMVKRARDRGITVLGYVHTSYSRRAAEQVRDEVDRYRAWYAVDGIFFDEATALCPADGAPASQIAYYQALFTHVKQQGGTVVLNPGRPAGECYMAVADIIVSFEHSYADYVQRYQAQTWTTKYPPSRFWHLVFAAPDQPDAIRTAVQLGRERGAGWIYVTPLTVPNPWETLPDRDFWQTQLTAVQHPSTGTP